MLTEASRHADFPSLSGRAYLNTAAEGIPPKSVLDALRQYGQDKLLGMDGRDLHAVQWQRAKSSLGQLLGFSADEVTLCSCSSEAFNLLHAALHLKEGDEVVITDLDFPAGVTPFLLGQLGVTTRLWKSDKDGALRVSDLRPLLSPRTRYVQVSLVSFVNGFHLNLSATAREVRAASPALLGVDVTQALCRVPLDLRDADIVVSSTHKWLLASHGGGIVVVPSRNASALTVPAGGWFNLEDPFSPNRYEQSALPKPGVAGFTVGMPNYPAVYAIAAAADYMFNVGIERIDKYARPLVEHCLAEIGKIPSLEVLTPDPGKDPSAVAGIIAFRHASAEALHRHLRSKGVHIMHHAGRLRAAIHGYNTAADIEWFLRELHEGLRRV